MCFRTLDVSQLLIHSNTSLDSNHLHLGYDYQRYDYVEKRNRTTKLDNPRFSGAIKVRNLDGIHCQVCTKRLSYKGKVLRIEDQHNFSSCDSSSPPFLSSLKEQIQPKPITEILRRISS